MAVSRIMLKAAICGGTENQFLLGEKYFYGYGEQKNLALAESWYKEAAKKGHAAATYMYGYMTINGLAGEINLRKGNLLIKKAAAKNNLKAMLLLARNYYYGYGIKRNEKKAFKTWEKGAKLGCAEAEYYLGLCYEKGIYVKPDLMRAKKHLYNALESGFDLAKIALNDYSGGKSTSLLGFEYTARTLSSDLVKIA